MTQNEKNLLDLISKFALNETFYFKKNDLLSMLAEIVEQEREACAKTVERALYGKPGCSQAAKAIRARGI